MSKHRSHKLVIAMLCWTVSLTAQQNPMFTNYHFNSLVFNPAYAGSNEHLALNLTHRHQWLGFDGAPITQTLTVHTPLRNERVGVGASVVNDRIGPSGSTELAAAYAYRMQLGPDKGMKLSLGLQASAVNWRSKLSQVSIEHPDDPSFQQNISRFLPNFGVGAYLYGKHFYLGISCPHILEHDLRQTNKSYEGLVGKNFRHLYLASGAIFSADGEQLLFRPSLLLQSAGFFSKSEDIAVGAPLSANWGVSVLVRQMFWAGLSYRTALSGKSSHDSANLWCAWSLRNGIRFGAAYDFTLSTVQTASSNSFELMLGYEFDIKVKQVASPRYF